MAARVIASGLLPLATASSEAFAAPVGAEVALAARPAVAAAGIVDEAMALGCTVGEAGVRVGSRLVDCDVAAGPEGLHATFGMIPYPAPRMRRLRRNFRRSKRELICRSGLSEKSPRLGIERCRTGLPNGETDACGESAMIPREYYRPDSMSITVETGPEMGDIRVEAGAWPVLLLSDYVR